MIMQPWTAGCQRGSGNERQEIRVLADGHIGSRVPPTRQPAHRVRELKYASPSGITKHLTNTIKNKIHQALIAILYP